MGRPLNVVPAVDFREFIARPFTCRAEDRQARENSSKPDFENEDGNDRDNNKCNRTSLRSPWMATAQT
ncbi:hypothetical protein BH23CHL2_BH23CHL2_21200 [soil metagenome]